MRSKCTLVLALVGALLLAAETAHAQTNPYPSALMPWSAPPSNVQPASYQADPAPAPMPAPTPTNGATSLEAALHAPCCDDFDIRCDGCERNFFAGGYGLVMTRARAPA